MTYTELILHEKRWNLQCRVGNERWRRNELAARLARVEFRIRQAEGSGTMSPTIILNHSISGAMKVRISEDASFWLGERQWTDIDSDGAIYDEGDFEETREQINVLLAEAEVRAA